MSELAKDHVSYLLPGQAIDLGTLRQWIFLVEPLIEARRHYCIDLVFANRSRGGYSGSSSCVRILHGNVYLCGILARSEKTLLKAYFPNDDIEEEMTLKLLRRGNELKFVEANCPLQYFAPRYRRHSASL